MPVAWVGMHWAGPGWPGGYALCGYATNVAQFESACGMYFGRIGEHSRSAHDLEWLGLELRLAMENGDKWLPLCNAAAP